MKVVKRYLIPLSLAFIVGMLSACSMAEEYVVDETKKNLELKMEQAPHEATFQDSGISFYLPEDTEVELVDEYNYVLDHDGQMSLLFLNDSSQHEDIDAILDDLYLMNEPVIGELREKNGKQAYFVVAEFTEGNYKVVVGYDGVKLSSFMNMKDIPDRAKVMFDIAQSVEK
ncbi:hypothetical protein CR203_13080 [Salipaludibacillus neizhouensis]|uniref:Lipoprotein n=1 Tax=Salipaludibacillus neizhouensis TaxID=885475 RepID=A0A3A9K211_9BACI|nr:hypothetical protein [Salipaludibacillus neizhouensis]RKL66767.1 hypothetical protein CR203_13080 [Salipaludibacillus neizhouensis]